MENINLDEVYTAMAGQAEPMRAADIAEAMVAAGFLKVNNSENRSGIQTRLINDMNDSRRASRFVKIDRGLYGLREWGSAAATPAAPSLSAQSHPFPVPLASLGDCIHIDLPQGIRVSIAPGLAGKGVHVSISPTL